MIPVILQGNFKTSSSARTFENEGS